MRRETIKREGGKHVLDAFHLVGISRNNRKPNGRGACKLVFSSRRSHYIDVVVGLAASYVGGRLAIGRVSLVREV
jgi:hypothetical protein